MEDGGYASTFQEYRVSGSKAIVTDISVMSSKPLWGVEPKAKVCNISKKQEIAEAQIENDKVYIGNVTFEGDKCVGGGSKEGFELTYKRAETLK